MPTRPRDTKRQPIPSEVEERFLSLSLLAHFSAFRVSDLCVDLHPLEESPPLPSPLFRVAIERSLCHSPSLFFLPISCSSRQLASFLVRLSASPRRMSSAAFKTAHPHTKAHKQRPTVAFINVWPRGKEGSCSRKKEGSYKNRDGSEGSRQKSFHSEFEMVFRSYAHSTAFVLLFARKWVKRPLPSFLSPF